MICASIGWFVGHAYLTAQQDGPVLVSTTIWHDPSSNRNHAFRAATEAINFAPAIGLPGRVLASGEPAWIVDIAQDNNFPRAEAARNSGIHSACAFPVLSGTEVVAVLEFFSDRLAAPDDFLLHLMSQIGAQLGRVVERKRAEDQLIYDASHDPLTQLPNRGHFLDRLTRAIARNRAIPKPCSRPLRRPRPLQAGQRQPRPPRRRRPHHPDGRPPLGLATPRAHRHPQRQRPLGRHGDPGPAGRRRVHHPAR